MYKEEIRTALKNLRLVSGGAIAGLLQVACMASPKLAKAMMAIAKNNDPAIKQGALDLHGALTPVQTRFREISRSSTVIELAQLSEKFEAAMASFAPLEPFLRPGRQALSALTGAYELVLQQNGSAPSLVGLIEPSIALQKCLEHYSALESVLTEGIEAAHDEILTSIEIDVDGDLELLSNLLGLLSMFATGAQKAVAYLDGGDEDESTRIQIAAIESGSPRVSGFLCVGHNMTMPRSMYATQEEVTGERAGVRFSARPA